MMVASGQGNLGSYNINASFNVGPVLAGAQQINQALQANQNQVNRLSASFANLSKVNPSKLIFLGLDLQQLAQSLAIISGSFALAGAASAKFAINFGDSMRDVNSLLQLSEEGLVRLSDRIVLLSEDPNILQGPTELSKGLKFIVSSGFESAEALEILRAAAVGATAGNANLTTVTQSLVGILNALPRGSINAQQAIDLLFSTVDLGILEFQDLTANLGETIGSIGETRIAFSEASAAIATITRSGIPASETMTSLNRILTSFIAPTAEAKATAADLGIEFSISSLRAKGLQTSLEEIVDAANGDIEAIEKLFGDMRALRGVLALTRNSGSDFAEVSVEMGKATAGLGSAAAAAAEQLKAPGNQIRLLLRDIERAGIVIGGDFLGIVLGTVNVIKNLVTSFSELPGPVRSFVEGLGTVLIAGTALLFVFARIITGTGAILNFFKQGGALLAGQAAVISANSAVLGANTAAAATNAGAVAYARNARGQFTGGVVVSSAAVQTNTAALGANTAAATANAGAMAGLLSILTRLSIVAVSVGAALFVGNKIKDFLGDITTAGQGTEKLLNQLESIQKLRDAPLAIPELNILGLDIFGESGTRQRLEKELLEPTLQVKSAFEQATAAQEDFVATGEEGLPKIRKQLENALSVAQDPNLVNSLEQALKRIDEEGARAVSRTGFSSLSAGQKFAIREFLTQLDSIAAQAEAKGLESVSTQARNTKQEILDQIGGLDLTIPISFDAVIDPFIANLEGQISEARGAFERETQGIQKSLNDLNRAQADNRLSQLELSLSTNQTQRSFKQVSNAVRELEDRLRIADQAVKRFSSPSLIGMGQLADQIFASSQAVAQFNLQIVGIEQEFAPAIAAAQEEVLKLRLQLTQVGKAAATISLDDIVAFQLKELREGVPVLRSIADKILAAQQGDNARSPEQKSLDAAEERLNKLQLERDLRAFQLQQGADMAALEQRRLELVNQLSFESQLRDLKKMAEAEDEITFEQAVEGLIAAREQQDILNVQLEEANALLRQRQREQDDIQDQVDELQRTSIEQQIEELKLNRQLEDRKKILDSHVETIQKQIDLLTLSGDLLDKQSEKTIQNLEKSTAELAKQADLIVKLKRLSPENFSRGPDMALGSNNEDLRATARAEAMRAGIDPELFERQIQQESNFNPFALSPAGARGIAQFMPGTAAGLGIDALNPFESLRAAADLMASYLTRYSGDWRQALAAYNAGPGALDKYGLDTIMSMEFANGETLQYILRILGHLSHMPGFYQGGMVGQGLPPGSPVVAQLHAGERVQSQREVAQMRGGSWPSGGGPSYNSSTYSWNVSITNNRGNADIYGKLSREFRLRRLSGRS